jgi:hypothetical protein
VPEKVAATFVPSFSAIGDADVTLALPTAYVTQAEPLQPHQLVPPSFESRNFAVPAAPAVSTISMRYPLGAEAAAAVKVTEPVPVPCVCAAGDGLAHWVPAVRAAIAAAEFACWLWQVEQMTLPASRRALIAAFVGGAAPALLFVALTPQECDDPVPDDGLAFSIVSIGNAEASPARLWHDAQRLSFPATLVRSPPAALCVA